MRNPFDDSIVTAEVQVAGQKEVDSAVTAAHEALSRGPWGSFAGAERASCMLKFADLVEQHSQELALLETIAMGKPVSLILGFDLPHMIGCYRCKG